MNEQQNDQPLIAHTWAYLYWKNSTRTDLILNQKSDLIGRFFDSVVEHDGQGFGLLDPGEDFAGRRYPATEALLVVETHQQFVERDGTAAI